MVVAQPSCPDRLHGFSTGTSQSPFLLNIGISRNPLSLAGTKVAQSYEPRATLSLKSTAAGSTLNTGFWIQGSLLGFRLILVRVDLVFVGHAHNQRMKRVDDLHGVRMRLNYIR